MELARVTGRVVATVKYPTLEGVRLLVIQPQDADGTPQGPPMIAADALQSGPGDLVAWVTGREAALALPNTFAPVDCTIVQIVDHAWRDAELLDAPWPPGGTGGAP
ncbi:MAG: EutN/CcmL family microcompartment protein [Alphaproteobacteria bacterium]|nr:EutN/CcmL family microcompartment protein [Alphaproteobacteria bacterium]